MIRIAGRNKKGRTILALGLSAENVRRLTKDRPILVRLNDLAPTIDADLMIFYGETEYEMTERMASLIGPETRIGTSVTPPADIEADLQ